MLLPKDMTIYHAAELKPLILAEVRGSARPELDLRNVAELDSAGVQLLYLARREAAAAGANLRIFGCSPVVREILDLMRFPMDDEAHA